MTPAALLDRPRQPAAGHPGTLTGTGPATPARLGGAGALVVRVPAPVGLRASAGVPAPPAVRPRRRVAVAPTRARRRVRLVPVLSGGAAVVAVALLAMQLGDADLGATLAAVHPAGVALGLGWIALSLLAAVFNLTGFSPLRLRLAPTLLAQLAVGGLRLVAPSAVSTPAVLMRYLVRSGAAVPDAATTVGVAQSAQLVATAGVVAGLGIVSGEGVSLPSARGALLVAAVVAGLAAAVWAAAGRSARVRACVRAVWRSQVALAAHARRHPGRVVVGVLASAALTLTHVLAFAACVGAAGGSVPLLTLTAIYLGAATAGSLVPTPGGIGPVEAALIAGLGAAGLPLPVATAAALLSRLVSVWLPAVPGVVALALLRRRGLL
jgi:uncharacterized membrane protein YbhN (UPF0104 family)